MKVAGVMLCRCFTGSLPVSGAMLGMMKKVKNRYSDEKTIVVLNGNVLFHLLLVKRANINIKPPVWVVIDNSMINNGLSIFLITALLKLVVFYFVIEFLYFRSMFFCEVHSYGKFNMLRSFLLFVLF